MYYSDSECVIHILYIYILVRRYKQIHKTRQNKKIPIGHRFMQYVRMQLTVFTNPDTVTRATYRLTIDPRSYRRSPNDHSFSRIY
jgi:hypothetical protein